MRSLRAPWSPRKQPRAPVGLADVAEVAFGSYVATQAAKLATPWPLQGRAKLGLTFLAAIGQGFARSRNPTDALVKMAIPATGLAAFLHRIARWAQTTSDQAITELGRPEPRRPRRPPGL